MLISFFLASAFQPHIVSDITTTPIPASSANLSADSAVLGAQTFFAVSTPDTGKELFASDGTPAGTLLVKDINPGPLSSNPAGFTVMGGYVYFSAATSDAGTELWRSDGTAIGTTRVADALPGPASSLPQNIVAVGSALFFTAYDNASNSHIWRSDGTTTTQFSSITNAKLLGGTNHLYVVQTDTTTQTQTVSVSDGSAAPTLLSGGTTSLFSPKIIVGDTLYVVGTTGAGSDVLVSVNGANFTALTIAAVDSPSGAVTSSLAATNNDLYFQCKVSAASKLCRHSLTGGADEAGTQTASYTGLVAGSDAVYFAANIGAEGVEPYLVLDSNNMTPRLIADINPSGNSSPSQFATFGDKVVFRASPDGSTSQWYATYASSFYATSSNAIDLSSVIPSTAFMEFTLFGKRVFLGPNDAQVGSEPMVTDGTVAGTTRLANLSADRPSSSPQYMAAVGSDVFFIASDATIGRQPFITSGDASSTHALATFSPSGETTLNGVMCSTGSAVYFAASLVNDDSSAYSAYVYAPGHTASASGLAQVLTPAAAPFPYPNAIVPYGDGAALATGSALYEATVTATSVLNANYSIPVQPIGTDLYMSTTIAGEGEEPARWDGSVIVPLGDVNPGAASSYPASFTSAVGKVFFSADDGTHGRQLWATDGTATGTALVKVINPSGSTAIQAPIALPDALIFAATDGTHGQELWRSDGTAAGTVMINDSNPGAGASFVVTRATSIYDGAYIVRVGDRVLYPGYEPNTGLEPWVSDGTSAGTHMLANLAPGSASSDPGDFFAWSDGQRAFFTANAGAGMELWVTDGTAGGTVPVTSFGSPLAFPASFRASGDSVYFAASDATTGREPYAVNVVGDATVTASSACDNGVLTVTVHASATGAVSGASLTVSGLATAPSVPDGCTLAGTALTCALDLSSPQVLSFTVPGPASASATLSLFGIDRALADNTASVDGSACVAAGSSGGSSGGATSGSSSGTTAGGASSGGGSTAGATATTPTKKGCGCHAQAPDAGPALVVLAVLWRRRRNTSR